MKEIDAGIDKGIVHETFHLVQKDPRKEPETKSDSQAPLKQVKPENDQEEGAAATMANLEIIEKSDA